MIVPMKKVLVFVIDGEESAALEALRDLGVMQLEAAGKVSETTRALIDARDGDTRPLRELEAIARKAKLDVGGVAEAGSGAAGADALRRTSEAIERRTRENADLEAVRRRRRNLAPWGDFDRELLEKLKAAGLHIALCSGGRKELERAKTLENTVVVPLSGKGGECRYALLSLSQIDTAAQPIVTLTPADDPRQLARDEERLCGELADCDRDLLALAAELPAIRRHLRDCGEKIEFSLAGDALAGHGGFASLAGFVPEPELDRLRAAARERGWGLYITDPADDEAVPVLIRYGNAFTRTIGPLFDFLGISPGYRELDISGGVMLFFTIFYAMIVGDAGYGCLFLAGAFALAWRFRRESAKRPVVALAFVLSLATIVWGVLSGNWFGCRWGGIDALTDEKVKDGNVQAFCFALALAQLTLGHCWLIFTARGWRPRLANLGWICILAGNFLVAVKMIVWPDAIRNSWLLWCYAPGLALVVLFGVNWKKVTDVFQFPFGIINSLTDVLSYIRLFAVGMAGACIAGAFNGMARDLAKISPWLVIGAVIVLLFGHGLNIGLNLLSVLAHGVRLNTLEFSNHTGLTWSGFAFKPFQHHKE